MGWRDRVRALLGLSAYTLPAAGSATIEDAAVKAMREAMGGQLQPPPQSQTRWYQRDLEAAEHAADGGDLSLAGRLMRAARKDCIVAGLLSTRCEGLVQLAKRFRGSSEIVAALEVGGDSIRPVFDDMAPPNELALMAADGVLIGVAVGELVPVEGRDFPVLVRLDPSFLVYRWNEGRWYYRTIVGLIPITPGDGRWVLHCPGGRLAPWQHGLWRAVGGAWITKSHAVNARSLWESTLANPAKVLGAPAGATEAQRDRWIQTVMSWGYNSAIELPPGYTLELLESNGIGAKSFRDTIREADESLMVAIVGQVVTTTGGSGFVSADLFKSVRSDLIGATAESLAFTVNTQILPQFVVARWGEEALDEGVVMSWDISPPKDRTAEANSMVAVANAIKGLTEALSLHEDAPQLDVGALCDQFGVPVIRAAANEKPNLRLVRGAAA